MDAGAVWHQDDGGGMLKNDAYHNVVLALDAAGENAGRANAEVRSPVGDLRARVYARPPFANLDLEAVLTIEALFDCRIIAGELELVLPLQLKRDIFQRVCRLLRESQCKQ